MSRHCLTCGTATPHRHIHDTAHGLLNTHMSGSERFICDGCGRITHAHDEGAEAFPFVFDTIRLLAAKAA